MIAFSSLYRVRMRDYLQRSVPSLWSFWACFDGAYLGRELVARTSICIVDPKETQVGFSALALSRGLVKAPASSEAEIKKKEESILELGSMLAKNKQTHELRFV